MHATVPEPSVSLVADDWFDLVLLQEIENLFIVVVHYHAFLID